MHVCINLSQRVLCKKEKGSWPNDLCGVSRLARRGSEICRATLVLRVPAVRFAFIGIATIIRARYTGVVILLSIGVGFAVCFKIGYTLYADADSIPELDVPGYMRRLEV